MAVRTPVPLAGREGGAPGTIPRVLRYYDATWFDYRVLWMNHRNRSMHLGYWDADTHGHADSLLRMNHVIAELAGIRPGERVLDAGCGVGGTALWLAAERGATVVGVSVHGRQVQRARRYAESRGLSDRCSFSRQDYAQLRCDDASFDVVWALESVCHAADKRPFLAEAYRVLRPRGRLVVADFFRTPRPHTPEGEAQLADWLQGLAMADLPTTEEFRTWVGEAGFGPLRVEDISAQVVPSLLRLYRLGTTFIVGETVLHGLGLRSGAAHGNIRSSRSIWTTFRSGLWHYAIIVGSKPDQPERELR
jgi:tocopherol O-methyltransferase